MKQYLSSATINLIALIVMVYLLTTTIFYFFFVPYMGFDYDEESGVVTERFFGDGLAVGDVVRQVNETTLAQVQMGDAPSLAMGVQNAEQVTVVFERDGEILSAEWNRPNFDRSEFLYRWSGSWWMATIFWLAGTVVVLLIRPKDDRWLLLIAFNYITAIWLMSGGVGHYGVPLSRPIFRAALWLSLPIYLHLHWLIPTRLPMLRWQWSLLYGVAGISALVQLTRQDSDWALIAFIIAIGGSLLLVLAQLIVNRRQWRVLWRTFLLLACGFLPLLITTGLVAVGVGGETALIGLLTLPVLPFAYLFAIYRQQISQIQLRSNNVVVLYLFVTTVLSAALIVRALWQFLLPQTQTVWLNLLLLIAAVLAAILLYPRFATVVSRVLFGIVWLPESLLTHYAERIATSTTLEQISQVITAEMLPSLLVREAAIVRWRDGQPAHTVMQTESLQLPANEQAASPAWVKLSLPLRVGGQEIGRFLFGRRDPDDNYPDIGRLQALTDQTAIAIVNSEQQANLQALHRTNIERQEAERRLLALELHDDVLNNLALLTMYVDDAPDAFFAAVTTLTQQLRRTIHNLRPPMLEYGLWITLDDFIRTVQQRGEQIAFSVPRTDVRHPAHVEQHLFRIVQQAIENALRHAHATTISVSGEISADQIALTIQDDGIGFAWQGAAQLDELLRQKHYGLVGMVERGFLIAAELRIDSSPEAGTTISVCWS